MDERREGGVGPLAVGVVMMWRTGERVGVVVGGVERAGHGLRALPTVGVVTGGWTGGAVPGGRRGRGVVGGAAVPVAGVVMRTAVGSVVSPHPAVPRATRTHAAVKNVEIAVNAARAAPRLPVAPSAPAAGSRNAARRAAAAAPVI